MLSWPDYCKRETLAKRLNLAVGAIDQLVARGLLPEPVMLGEAKLWRWDDVDAWLSKTRLETTPLEDPYLARVRSSREAAPTRKIGAK